MIGNFNPCKGHDCVLETVRILIDRGQRVCLWLAGGESPSHQGYRAFLEEKYAKEVSVGATRFLGFRNDAASLVSAADIAVCGSHGEAFGRTCAEAMMLGKPVVATEDNGYKEQITDGVTGLLVSPGDPMAMAAATSPGT